jgi:hypothetical protein
MNLCNGTLLQRKSDRRKYLIVDGQNKKIHLILVFNVSYTTFD